MGLTVAELEQEVVSQCAAQTGLLAEVADARGTARTLGARLDVALNPDGTLRSPAATVSFVTEIAPIISYPPTGAYVALEGDLTAVYVAKRRLRINGALLPYVTSSTYDAGGDYTVVNFSTPVGNSITSIEYSFDPAAMPPLHYSGNPDIEQVVSGISTFATKHLSDAQYKSLLDDIIARVTVTSLASVDDGAGVDLVGRAFKYVDTIDDLRTLPDTGAPVYVKGHTTPGDGGEGTFKYDISKAAIDDNGITVLGWVRRLNGFVTPEMFGGDVVAAAAYCTANGVPIFGKGTYTIKSTLDLFCFGDLSQATINVDATVVNPAIRVHATSFAKPINIKLPMVNNTGHVAGDGWIGYDTSVGVSIDNLYNSDVYIPQVKGFGIGAYVGGTTAGNSYNTYRIGECRNNKINLKVGPKSAGGWANENTFHVSRCRHDTSEANGLVPFVGTRNIQMTANGHANVPNNNLFIKPCVEGDTATVSGTEFMIDLIDAQANTFLQPRWETPHPNGPTLRLESTVAEYCTGNVFINNGIYQPNITKVGTVTANTVIGSGRVSQSFDSGGDGVGFSNGYTDGVDGPHIQGFKAATTALGKRRTATDWVYRMHATGINGKLSTDAEARMRISWSTPGIYMGTGTINPVSGFQPYGNYQIDVTNSTRFKVQGTWDGGYLMMGTYALWVDGSGKLRIKSGAPASATDGTIVGTQS